MYQHGNRYDNMNNNVAKCFNSLIVDTRKLSLVSLLEYICGLCHNWFYEMQNMWSVSMPTHSKYAETIMVYECDKARQYKVNPIDYYRFHVKDGGLDGIVSLNTNECNCRQFESLQIPCSHAIAAARERNINPFTFFSWLYSVESLVLAYVESISPFGHVPQNPLRVTRHHQLSPTL